MFRAPQRLVEDFKTTSRVAGGVSSQADGGRGTRRGIGALGDARRHSAPRSSHTTRPRAVTTLVSHFNSPTSYKSALRDARRATTVMCTVQSQVMAWSSSAVVATRLGERILILRWERVRQRGSWFCAQSCERCGTTRVACWRSWRSKCRRRLAVMWSLVGPSSRVRSLETRRRRSRRQRAVRNDFPGGRPATLSPSSSFSAR